MYFSLAFIHETRFDIIRWLWYCHLLLLLLLLLLFHYDWNWMYCPWCVVVPIANPRFYLPLRILKELFLVNQVIRGIKTLF